MKIIYSLILFTIVYTLNAQTIVSTLPENKNVVLEEYTGIHCGSCPSAHITANWLLNQYPNDLFLVSIHASNSAEPGLGEPDYRTVFGDSLFAQIDAAGVPTGTINRHAFTSPTPIGSAGFAYYSSSWNSCSSQMLSVLSPVNIAIDANMNYTTRQLTVLVEVYYTASSLQTTNQLNLALTQNWIKGPQLSMEFNPTNTTTDGQYYHMHMLRHMITGIWGVTIPATTVGTFWDSTFVYTVPADYGGIPVELGNIDVVAFVSESRKEILSGTGKHVQPPTVDAALPFINKFQPTICTDSVVAEIKLFNKGSNTLSSVDIHYSLNNSPASVLHWTGSIPSLDSTTIILPAVPLVTNGLQNLTIYLTNPNNTIDFNKSNDTCTLVFNGYPNNIYTPFAEGFDAVAFPPDGFSVINANLVYLKAWGRSNEGHTAAGSAFINWYYVISGSLDDFMMSPVDLTGINNPMLSFYVAHRQYSTSNDQLQVDISTDCGQSWTTEWLKSGPALATGASMLGIFSSPDSNEWREEIIDLSLYSGEADVMIRFRGVSNFGNCLFLDDINISGSASVDDLSNKSNLVVYPNPAKETITVSYPSGNASWLRVINPEGMEMIRIVNPGEQNTIIDVSSLKSGIYFIEINGTDNARSVFIRM